MTQEAPGRKCAWAKCGKELEPFARKNRRYCGNPCRRKAERERAKTNAPVGKPMDERKKVFRELCRDYSVPAFGAMVAMVDAEDTPRELRFKIMAYLVNQGVGAPRQTTAHLVDAKVEAVRKTSREVAREYAEEFAAAGGRMVDEQELPDGRRRMVFAAPGDDRPWVEPPAKDEPVAPVDEPVDAPAYDLAAAVELEQVDGGVLHHFAEGEVGGVLVTTAGEHVVFDGDGNEVTG